MLLGALVLTLGFEPGSLVSAVARAAAEGFAEGARIVVFTAAFPDERVERAWRDFQNIVGMMGFAKALGVSIERQDVPLGDFAEAVRRVRGVFEELKRSRVKIAITGGMRALGLAVFVAYLLTEWAEEPRLEVYLEGRGMAVEIPPVRRLMGAAITPERVALLRAMKPGAVYRPSDLCGLVMKDRSTVYRQLQALAASGLVERVDGGFRITKLGMLLV